MSQTDIVFKAYLTYKQVQQVLFIHFLGGWEKPLLISPLYLSSPRFFFSFFNGESLILSLLHPDERIAVGWWFHRSSRASFPCSLPLSSFALCAVIAGENSPQWGTSWNWHMSSPESAQKKKRKPETPFSLYLQRDDLTESWHKTLFNTCAKHILYFRKISYQFSHPSELKRQVLQTDVANEGKYKPGASRKPVFVFV